MDAAAACNPWFDPAFVDIRAGDAFAFGPEDASVDIVGQNCHFNMFELDDLTRALCLSGALTYDAYIARLIDAGFGEIAIRARRPDRLLDAPTYGLDSPPFSATNRMFSLPNRLGTIPAAVGAESRAGDSSGPDARARRPSGRAS